MNFIDVLHKEISHLHLLKHPFYQAWTAGTLSLSVLQDYAKQYYPHVLAFPRYVSGTHFQCSDLKTRQVLLENLIDEERGEENHPELWLRFAEALGVERSAVQRAEVLPAAQNLVETFIGFAKSSYAEGLGALYAYEYQVPEIAHAKIEGLKKFYGVENQRGLAFFEVHKTADVYHSEACQQLLNQLTDEEKVKALNAARVAGQALWDFLSAVYGGARCSA